MNKLLPFVLLILCFNVFSKVVPVIPHYEIPQDKEPPFKDYVLFKSNKKIDLYRSKENVGLNFKQGLDYNLDAIKNLREVDGAGNLIGPIDIFSSVSNSPRFLKFKFTTNNEKFSIEKISYQFFAPNEDIKSYTSLTDG